MEEGFDLFLTVMEVNMNAVWKVSLESVCGLHRVVKMPQRKVWVFEPGSVYLHIEPGTMTWSFYLTLFSIGV